MTWKIACFQMVIALGRPDINFQVAEQWDVRNRDITRALDNRIRLDQAE